MKGVFGGLVLLMTTGCATDAPPSRQPSLDHILSGSFVAESHALAGGWALTDTDGQPFDAGHLVGRWSVVGVGYTSCPDVCPSALLAMPGLVATLAETLPAGASTQVVFLAVDPARDTEGLPAYREYYQQGLGAPLVAATGTPSALRSAAADVGLAFDVDGTEVQHSTSWALVAPSGSVEGYILHPTATDRVREGLVAALPRERARQGAAGVGVEDAWLRPPPPGGHIGAAYGRLVDLAGKQRTLVSATKADGAKVAVHETVITDGLAGMREARVELAAHGEAVLEPLGAHLMVPHAGGVDHVDLRLVFHDGEVVWARFPARAP